MWSGQREGSRSFSVRAIPRPNQGVCQLPKGDVHILHPFVGSVQRYCKEIADPGWFAGLVFDPEGKARYSVATFVRRGGLGTWSQTDPHGFTSVVRRYASA